MVNLTISNVILFQSLVPYSPFDFFLQRRTQRPHLDDLGVEVTELAEVLHLVLVVALEDLVEAGEAEDFLPAVEFHLDRDDASAGGGHVHIR